MQQPHEECITDYVIIDVCKNGEEAVRKTLSSAVINARKGPGRVFQIAILCPQVDYTKYLLNANEVVANNMDVRIELYEVSSEDGALKTLRYLANRCKPRQIIKVANVDLGEFENLNKP
ncbi:hypothetical protein [Caldivirga sp.]|uniref:hypothetical protein n=1 Tax=Caldivirga sp. TaxID=2080243 RepID=UPI003D130FB2